MPEKDRPIVPLDPKPYTQLRQHMMQRQMAGPSGREALRQFANPDTMSESQAMEDALGLDPGLQPLDYDRSAWAQSLRDIANEEDRPDLAEQVTPELVDQQIKRFGVKGYENINFVRKAYYDFHQELGITATKASSGLGYYWDKFRGFGLDKLAGGANWVADKLDTDTGQIVLADLEPYDRPRQSWLWSQVPGAGRRVFSAFRPRVPIEGEVDENGNQVYMTPGTAGLLYAIGEARGEGDYKLAQRVDQARSAMNAFYDGEGVRRNITFADVQEYQMGAKLMGLEYAASMKEEFSDATLIAMKKMGADYYDTFYKDMSDKGALGNIAMFGWSVAQSTPELFDPALYLERVPNALVRMLRGFASKATVAERTARAARNTRRLPQVADAVRAASKRLEESHAILKAEPQNVQKQKQFASSLQHYTEMVDLLEEQKRIDGRSVRPNELRQAEAVAAKEAERAKLSPVERDIQNVEDAIKAATGEDGKIKARVIEGEDIVYYDNPRHRMPGRGTYVIDDVDIRIPGMPEGNFQQGLVDDALHRKVRLNREYLEDPIGSFQKEYPGMEVHTIGHVSTPVDHLRDIWPLIEIISDKMGLRVIPFSSSGFKAGTELAGKRLGGAYIKGARTIFLNVARDNPIHVLSTFMHEVNHHIFNRILGTLGQDRLLATLAKGGAKWNKIAKALEDQGYQKFKTTVQLDANGIEIPGSEILTPQGVRHVGDEFAARTVSELMHEPSFWQMLMDADPDIADEMIYTTMELAQWSQEQIAVVGGRAPSKWMNKIYTDELGRQVDVWHAHRVQTHRAIVAALSANKDVKRRLVADIKQRMIQTRMALAGEREGLARMGQGTPLIDEGIQKLDMWIRSAETDPNFIAADWPQYMDFQAEQYIKLTPDQMRRIRKAENAAALRAAHEVTAPKDANWLDEMGETERLQRVNHGPDSAEYAGDGLGRLVNGAEVGDLLVPMSEVPERSAGSSVARLPGVNDDGLIDIPRLREIVEDYRRVTRNYARGVAHGLPADKLGPEERIIVALEDAIKDMEKNGKWKYDKSWIPPATPTSEERMLTDWLKDHRRTMWDRIATGLYPESWNVRFTGPLAGVFNNMRESMRVTNDYDPGAWDMLRQGQHNAEAELSAYRSRVAYELEQFGAIERSERQWWRKPLSSKTGPLVKKDKGLSEYLGRLLNVEEGSAGWNQTVQEMGGISEQQLQAVRNLRKEMDSYAFKLGIIDDEDMYVKGYFPHRLEAAVDFGIYAEGGHQVEFFGLPKGGEIALSHLLRRTNANLPWNFDAVDMLDLYGRGVSRKLHLEPATTRFMDRARVIAKKPGMGWYDPYARMTTLALRGNPGAMDEVLNAVWIGLAKSKKGGRIPQHPITQGLMGVSALVYSSLMTFNRRYPIMSIATAFVTTTARYGLFRTAKGIFAMATPEGQATFKQMGGAQLWDEVVSADAFRKWTSMAAHARVIGPSIHDTEYFIRGMTFWASVDMNLNRMGFMSLEQAAEYGYKEAILWESLLATEEVNHYFGAASKPPLLQTVSKPLATGATQFLSFPFKQAEVLAQITRENPGNIFNFIGMSGWMAEAASRELGISIDEYVGLKSIMTRPAELVSPVTSALMATLDFATEQAKMFSGTGNALEAQRATSNMITSWEVFIPPLNAMAKAANTQQAIEEEKITRPGTGISRSVDVQTVDTPLGKLPIPSGRPGERGEGFALLSGMKSTQQRAMENVMRATRRIKQDNALLVFDTIIAARRAARDNDFEAFNKHTKKLAELGIPMPDVGRAMSRQKQVEVLDWMLREGMNDPEMFPIIMDLMEREGIPR